MKPRIIQISIIVLLIVALIGSVTNIVGAAPITHKIRTGIGYGNQLQVILIGKNGQPFLVWQDRQGGWHNYGVLPHDTKNTSYDDIAVGNAKSGDLQVILLGHVDGQLYVTKQDHSTGAWSYQYALPNPTSNLKFTAVAAYPGNCGGLQVVCLGNDKQPYLIRQDQNGYFSYIGKISIPYQPTTFQALTMAVSGGNLLLILLGVDGQPYIMQQNQQGNFTNFTAMDNPAKIQYRSVTAGISYNNKLNVILTGVIVGQPSDGKPYLIEEDGTTLAGKYKGIIPHYMNMPVFTEVTTEIGNDGTPQVICIGQDGQIYLIYQDHTSGEWYYYGALPTHPQKPKFYTAVAGVGNGRNLQLICLDSNNQPYLIWQDYSRGSWSYYGPVPYITQIQFISTVIGVGNNGNLQVICLGDDGQLYLKWQDNSSMSWSKFELLPIYNATIPMMKTSIAPTNPKVSPRLTPLAIGTGNGGNLQVICVGADGKPYLIWQNNINGAWSFYGKLPTSSTSLKFNSVATGIGTGCLQVICLSEYGWPYLIWQDKQGNWYSYGKLPDINADIPGFKALATGIGNGGNLQVVLLGKYDGLPYLIWQDNKNGSWSYYGVLPWDQQYNLPNTSIAAGVGGDGNLQVVSLRRGGGLPMLVWQDKNKGSWSWYGILPTDPANSIRYATLSMCLDQYNELLLFSAAGDGKVYCIWQDPRGNWFTSGQVMFGRNPAPLASDVTCGRCADGGYIVVLIGLNDGRAYFEESSKRGYSYGLLE